MKIADDFERKWNFPHCLGGLDGKHIRIVAPNNAGSNYYNYKGFNSIVLMALVDADYEFAYVDIGAEGREGDSGVWGLCTLADALAKGRVQFPAPAPLPNSDTMAPYCIVADDAFTLSTNLMKPFSRRGLADSEMIFNYRLSRARRVSENAFGILANRFRCFLGALYMLPSHAKKVVAAAVTLHNFLRRKSKPYMGAGSVDQEDASLRINPGEWRQDPQLAGLEPLTGHNASRAAKAVRVVFADYFMSDVGLVPWQFKVLNV